jgi:hypothetical protein
MTMWLLKKFGTTPPSPPLLSYVVGKEMTEYCENLKIHNYCGTHSFSRNELRHVRPTNFHQVTN